MRLSSLFRSETPTELSFRVKGEKFFLPVAKCKISRFTPDDNSSTPCILTLVSIAAAQLRFRYEPISQNQKSKRFIFPSACVIDTDAGPADNLPYRFVVIFQIENRAADVDTIE